MAATRALFDAAKRLSLKDMRRALQAGADASHRRAQEIKSVAACMLQSQDAAVRKLTEATRSYRQMVALRLLDEHGGLDADAATEALNWALRTRCSPGVVQMLLNAGAGFDFAHISALHIVSRADVARQLVAAGADANASNESSRLTPLHVLFGGFYHERNDEQLEVANVLLAAGADVNAFDSRGYTCLLKAVFFDLSAGRPRGLQWLLDAGADPTIVMYNGSTLLDHAITEMQRRIDYWHMDPEDEVDIDIDQLLAVMAFIAGTVTWYRRRHMLLAICGRYGGSQ